MLTKFLCTVPLIINLTGQPWNKVDESAKERAIYVCKVRYDGCLKRFIKKEVQVYHAICGESSEKR